MENTIVTWWKDGIPLLTSDPIIRQEDISSFNHTTTLVFNPTRRNDSGNYRVSVENRFDAIPRHLQVAELHLGVRIIGKMWHAKLLVVVVSKSHSNQVYYIDDPFLLFMSVAPAKPEVTVSESFNTISWSLPAGISEDERANSFTVSLNFANGTVAQELTITGEVRGQAELDVIPGMTYAVAVIAHNVDGSAESDVQDFTTLPGGTLGVVGYELLRPHFQAARLYQRVASYPGP